MNVTGRALQRAAFLDRDGVINIDRGYVYRREDFQFVAGALEGARRLHEMGFLLVVTSNQSGIGRGLYTEADFHALTGWMRDEFQTAGAPLAGVYYCPHHPTEAIGAYLRVCECRKPAPGMSSDLEAARTAGVPIRVLLGTDAREMPALPSADDLASAAFRGLFEATADVALLAPAHAAKSVAG